jgi:LysR family hydrogen peroxide-inducible transcriptional activator
VAAGFGCTLLPALAAHPPRGEDPSFVIRPLRSPSASRRIGLVWRRGSPNAQQLSLLGEMVRDNPASGTRTVPLERGAARALI